MARKRYTMEQIIGYLRQAEVMVGRGCTIEEVLRELEQWRHHYNHIRPHTSLGYQPPAPMTRTSTPIRAKRFT